MHVFAESRYLAFDFVVSTRDNDPSSVVLNAGQAFGSRAEDDISEGCDLAACLVAHQHRCEHGPDLNTVISLPDRKYASIQLTLRAYASVLFNNSIKVD